MEGEGVADEATEAVVVKEVKTRTGPSKTVPGKTDTSQEVATMIEREATIRKRQKWD